jgi:AcrR family transcriptional regulator
MHSPEYEQCAQDFLELEDSEGRLRILRAAYPLFVERGYDGVSMQGIADAVPLNKATLYHHFQSKDDLFQAVVRMAMTRLYQQIEEIIEKGGSAGDQLASVAEQVFQESQSEFGQLLADAKKHLPVNHQRMLVERCADPWTLYEQIFVSGIQNGEIPKMDPRLASTLFVGLIQGQTWSLRTGRLDGPLDGKRDSLRG